MYKTIVKRLLDVLLSGIAIIFLSPLLLIVSLLVRIKLGYPVVFKQQRPGKIDPKSCKEKIFTLYKFRTMTEMQKEIYCLLKTG